MDFGSKFVYDYQDSEEEVVSDDELEEGLEAYTSPEHVDLPLTCSLSIENEYDATCAAPPPPPIHTSRLSMSAKPGKKSRKYKKKSSKKSHHWLENEEEENEKNVPINGKRWRRADTNVLSVKFGHLKSASNMHTGDAVCCGGCGAVLNHMSTMIPSGDSKIWKCEFCYHDNTVDLESEEVPQKDDVTFMLQPAPTTAAGGRSGVDDSLVVFCVDTSGSMCVTTEVPGRVKLRGDHLERLQTLNTRRESQYMPGQRRDVTFVSRLQGVQAAVDYQLGEMLKAHPNRRVALVTFNNEVTVVGDGSAVPVHHSGDKLSDWDLMLTAGASLTLPQPIKMSRRKLGDQMFELEEGGQTALGPALLLSVSLAAQVTGSKVIICTDGMANIGLGAMDSINNTSDYGTASNHYKDVTQYATDHGVTVSVTTIKGTDCKLVELGEVAANTGGQVNIVDPMKLTQEFGNILADSTIATNVQATLILHTGLYFRDEESKGSKVTRQIGNVTKDTEITFEYGIKRKQTADKPVPQGTDERQEEDMDTEPPNETPGEATTTPQAAETNTDETSAEAASSETKRSSIHSDSNIQTASGSSSHEPSAPGSVYQNEPVPESKSQDALVPGSTSQNASVPGSTSQNAPVPASTSQDAPVPGSTSQNAPVPGNIYQNEPVPGSSGAAGVPSIEGLDELPFQLQIVYTDLEGGQAMRVLTQAKPITKDRKVAEKEMNAVLLGVHGTKQSANMALGGNYTNSRLNAFMYQRLMYRNVDRQDISEVYDRYLDLAAPVESHISNVQECEMATRGHTYSDDEDDDDDGECYDDALHEQAQLRPKPLGMLGKAAAFFRKSKSEEPLVRRLPPPPELAAGLPLPRPPPPPTKGKMMKKKAFVGRRMTCPDDTANVFYSAQQANSTSEAWSKKK